jgi:hypothetical protein
MTEHLDPAEPVPGPLSRWSAAVYWFVVVEALLVVTSLPAIVAIPLLDRDASNLPLAALTLVPLGPAVSGALFAWRRFDEDRDLSPARHFWRGYRLNVLDVLRVWVPALLVLTVAGTNLTNLRSTGLPSGLGVLNAVIALAVVLWAAHAVVVVSLFAFRLRDAVRIAGYYLLGRPLVTLGVLSLAVLATGVVLVTSDWVFVALGSVSTFLLHRNARPMVADVRWCLVASAESTVPPAC